MQSQQSVNSSLARVFHDSLDWRFLLPLSDPQRIFVFFEDDPQFCQTLTHVGIPVSNQPSFLDIQQKAQKETSSLAFPFGVPLNWVSAEAADQIEFFRSIRKLLGEHGNLLVGFDNAWSHGSKLPAKYYRSTPRRMAAQLQQAGFRAIKSFGVFPDLHIPEYIFELHPGSVSFALQHRFKRKTLFLKLLQLLSATAGMTRLVDFLPCYFIAAMV